MTQRDLARVLGGARPLSVPLISSWENPHRPVVPPADRLLSYAAFFASKRSVASRPYRLLDDAELTAAERDHRDRLERELLDARAAASRSLEAAPVATATQHLDGPWRFPDGKPVTIVCPEVPARQRDALPTLDDPRLVYADLYSYADLDALFALYGHIRAANPLSDVRHRKADDLTPDDYTTHLVLLGGLDWNRATRQMIQLLESPVAQEALGDERFRDRNAAFLRSRFADCDTFSVLARVLVVDGAVVTPDWSSDAARLHAWGR